MKTASKYWKFGSFGGFPAIFSNNKFIYVGYFWSYLEKNEKEEYHIKPHEETGITVDDLRSSILMQPSIRNSSGAKSGYDFQGYGYILHVNY